MFVTCGFLKSSQRKSPGPGACKALLQRFDSAPPPPAFGQVCRYRTAQAPEPARDGWRAAPAPRRSGRRARRSSRSSPAREQAAAPRPPGHRRATIRCRVATRRTPCDAALGADEQVGTRPAAGDGYQGCFRRRVSEPERAADVRAVDDDPRRASPAPARAGGWSSKCGPGGARRAQTAGALRGAWRHGR
jgi:hypothetical protein